MGKVQGKVQGNKIWGARSAADPIIHQQRVLRSFYFDICSVWSILFRGGNSTSWRMSAINGSDGWMWSKQGKPHGEIDGWNNVDERTKRHPLAPISNWRRNVWHLTLSSQARPQNVMVMIRQRAESMHFGIWNPVDYCELWIVDVAINAGEAETDNWSCRLIEKRGWSRFYKFSLHLFSVALLLGGQ